MRYGYWKPYVPVAERRGKARQKTRRLRENGLDVQPVEIEGRKIANTFWGIAWNDHLESFGDYANRIPRGRTYVRNGSVCHLDIQTGEISAMVSGSELYEVSITIKPLAKRAWNEVKKKCAGQVGSLLDLLQGKLSTSVMTVVTDQKEGLFPSPGQIQLDCNCPDVAYMCKHIAAVLYGVGARLDNQPELLFKLRGVDHEELISVDAELADAAGKTGGKGRRIADDSLADVFGIEISPELTPVKKKSTARKKVARKAAKKKSVVKKKAVKKTAKKKSAVRKKAAKKVTRKAVKKTARKTAAKAVTRTAKPTKKMPAAKKQIRKIAKKKITKKKIPRLRNAKNELIYLGSTVAAMRKKFNMTQIEFALLLGVSTLTVKNWEENPAELKLRRPSREALQEVEKLSKRKAWQELTEL